MTGPRSTSSTGNALYPTRRSDMTSPAAIRPPLPPFTLESAKEKVRLAEDGWNSRDAAKVALAYSLDT
ncbi:nuclear transport factor 2 family protein, partial [Burkholderia cenocepacia]|uniref:nuclear transport factor 2 family protein n=1 Tax=Burkholderia cenocepacia TaxID=95486 RepID=UPI0021AB5B0E